MITNEIRRLKNQLNLMEQEGANQLLLSFNEFMEKNNNPPSRIFPTTIKVFKSSLMRKLMEISPEDNKQLKLKL